MKKLIFILFIIFTQIIVAQDTEEGELSFEETKILAEQVDADAQYQLGVCYEYDEGTSKDLKKAFYWYTKSAEQDYVSAQYNLAICYFEGDGTLKDLKKATYWCKKAYENGNENVKKLWDNEELWKYE